MAEETLWEMPQERARMGHQGPPPECGKISRRPLFVVDRLPMRNSCGNTGGYRSYHVPGGYRNRRVVELTGVRYAAVATHMPPSTVGFATGVVVLDPRIATGAARAGQAAPERTARPVARGRRSVIGVPQAVQGGRVERVARLAARTTAREQTQHDQRQQEFVHRTASRRKHLERFPRREHLCGLS